MTWFWLSFFLLICWVANLCIFFHWMLVDRRHKRSLAIKIRFLSLFIPPLSAVIVFYEVLAPESLKERLEIVGIGR